MLTMIMVSVATFLTIFAVVMFLEHFVLLSLGEKYNFVHSSLDNTTILSSAESMLLLEPFIYNMLGLWMSRIRKHYSRKELTHFLTQFLLPQPHIMIQAQKRLAHCQTTS